MGIYGLLQLLKPITKDKKLCDYQNTRVAVDTYVWLHKGVYTCAYELASGKDSDAYIGFTVRKVEMLLHNKITPVMVRKEYRGQRLIVVLFSFYLDF